MDQGYITKIFSLLKQQDKRIGSLYYSIPSNFTRVYTFLRAYQICHHDKPHIYKNIKLG